VDFEALADSPANAQIEGLTECFGVDVQKPVWESTPSPHELREYWPMSDVWQRFSGDPVVPYDLDRRRERYREAYLKMQPIIDFYGEAKKDFAG
jgi:hypothetical protein